MHKGHQNVNEIVINSQRCRR